MKKELTDKEKIRLIVKMGVVVGLLSLGLKRYRKYSPEEVIKYLKDDNYKQEFADQEFIGFFKANEQVIPYYEDLNASKYYSYENGEYIGDLMSLCGTINSYASGSYDDSILYAKEQVIPFMDCNPNVFYNYETVSSFTEETYQNLEESYFENHPFSSEHFQVYEILNLTTNKEKYIIGRQVSRTKVFNFETYMLEDYTGHAIKDMEVPFEKEEYYYDEILNFIAKYREQNQSLKLERK